MSLRKITKNRGSFPSDEALSKLFYLALRNISQKWNMPIRDWKAALNRFSIEFEDRVPQQWPLTLFTQKFGHPFARYQASRWRKWSTYCFMAAIFWTVQF